MDKTKTLGELTPTEASKVIANFGKKISNKDFKHLVNIAALNVGK